MKIGIVISSTRPSRIGHKVAQWVAEQAPEGVQVEIVDLAEVALPFLADPSHPKMGEYTEPTTIAWAETVSSYDAMIITLAEYNGGYPAPLKNAIDTLFAEWNEKPIGVIGYGWGAAARAVTAIEPVLATVQAVQVPGPGLSFNTELGMDGEILADAPAAEVAALYGELAAKVPASV